MQRNTGTNTMLRRSIIYKIQKYRESCNGRILQSQTNLFGNTGKLDGIVRMLDAGYARATGLSGNNGDALTALAKEYRRQVSPSLFTIDLAIRNPFTATEPSILLAAKGYARPTGQNPHMSGD